MVPCQVEEKELLKNFVQIRLLLMRRRHNFRIIKRAYRVQGLPRSFVLLPTIGRAFPHSIPLVEYALPVYCRLLPVGVLVAQFRYIFIGD